MVRDHKILTQFQELTQEKVQALPKEETAAVPTSVVPAKSLTQQTIGANDSIRFLQGNDRWKFVKTVSSNFFTQPDDDTLKTAQKMASHTKGQLAA